MTNTIPTMGTVAFTPTGMAIGGNTANVSLDISAERDAIAFPGGPIATRPNGQRGWARYNSDLDVFEGFFQGGWFPFGGPTSIGPRTFAFYGA